MKTTIEINGKQYQLDIEKAIEQGLLKEKDNKPRSWEEYENTASNNVFLTSVYQLENDVRAYDIFYSEDEAKAFCALGKLIQLRDAWWGDWKPDWSDNERKYYLYVFDSEICIGDSNYCQYTFAFPTKEMVTDFLETFRDLIEQAKMFL